jgi:hypothetical protein
VADLTIGQKRRLTVAIEFERSVNRTARYREIVERISEETQIDMLLYLTALVDIVYQLKAILIDSLPDCARGVETILFRPDGGEPT